MPRIKTQDTVLPSGIVVQATSPTPVVVKKAKGPADSDGPVTYHPDFKFTPCPSPKLGVRTNTHPK